MKIKKSIDNDKLDFVLKGRLDTNTSPILDEEIKKNIGGIKHFNIDFKELNYISSAGLRVILATQKIMNKQGSMTIKNVNDLVMEVFDATGFSDILTIE